MEDSETLRAFQEADKTYSDFITRNSGYEAACSGVGSCDYCNKRLYPLRTNYLRAYIRLFKKYRNLCPQLYWVHAETAKMYDAGDFHRSKCTHGIAVTDCPCELADFLRVAFNANENTQLASLGDQIYPVFHRTK